MEKIFLHREKARKWGKMGENGEKTVRNEKNLT